MRLANATLFSRGLGQGTVLQTAIGTAYIRARLHVVSAYPVIDRSPRLAVASSRRIGKFILLLMRLPKHEGGKASAKAMQEVKASGRRYSERMRAVDNPVHAEQGGECAGLVAV